VHQATGSPIAAAALDRIAKLYDVERRLRGQPPEVRQENRAIHSRPIIEAMKPWLEKELHRVSAKSTLAEDIRYTLARWDALCRFLGDGRIELDTNPVERAIRPI